MLMPVIFGAFGVSIDLAVGTYTNTNLQSALDTATQTALSRATNPGTNGNTTFNPTLTEDAAHEYVIDFYDTNRTDAANTNENPFLNCQTSATNGTLITPDSGCGWTEQNFSFEVDGNELITEVTVYETSNPVFIKMIGIDEVKYTIKSSARTTFATN